MPVSYTHLKYSKLEMFPNQSVAFPERFWYTFLNEIQEGGVLDDGGKTGRTRTIKPVSYTHLFMTYSGVVPFPVI